MTDQSVNVLIVDDDQVDVMLLERALRHHKVFNRLSFATNGSQAIDMLRGENGRGRIGRPFLILLDLNMPAMGGLEFLKEIRADNDLCDSIVFALTTSDDERDINAAYKYHVAGYIIKSNTGSQFDKLVALLDQYWSIVELPRNHLAT